VNNQPTLGEQFQTRGRNLNVLEYFEFYEEMDTLTLQETRSNFTGIITDGYAQAARLAVGELDTVAQIPES
jgi:hypothetical protein